MGIVNLPGSTMEYNINIWLLCAIIPAILATYLLPDNQEASKPDDIVRVLVEQVKDLQNVVTEQGQRIEALEKRLKATERQEKSGDISKEAGDRRDHGNEGEPLHDSSNNQTSSLSKNDENSGPEIKDPVSIPAESSNNENIKRGIIASENVAFSAYLDHSVANLGLGQTVKFNQVVLNDGNHYNTHSGIFTVPVNGVYFLTFHLFDVRGRAAVQLMVDDVHKVEADVWPTNSHDVMGGNIVILRLNAGQSVWLQTYDWDDAALYSAESAHYVTFSGFLMY